MLPVYYTIIFSSFQCYVYFLCFFILHFSGLAGTQRTIANKLSNSTVITNAFSLSRTMMETAPTEVESWLKEINVIN